MTMTSSYEQHKLSILSHLPLEFHDVLEELAGLMTRPREGDEAKLKNLFLLKSKLEPVLENFSLKQYDLGYDSGYAAGKEDYYN